MKKTEITVLTVCLALVLSVAFNAFTPSGILAQSGDPLPVVSNSILGTGTVPVNGTSEVQTLTIANFGTNTLRVGFLGASKAVTFTGTESNAGINTALDAALESLSTVGTGGVSVVTGGTTDRAAVITFAGDLVKLSVPLFTATCSGGSATAATLSTTLTGSNNDLTFTAVTSGTYGNGVTIELLDPSANDETIAVDVVNKAITVTLATGTGGAITSTGSNVITAITASVPASALVTVANKSGNDGTGVVTALSATPLAGGLAAPTASVAETTPGVTADGRSSSIGQLLKDMNAGVLYINTGTTLQPTWTKVGAQ